MNLSRSGQLANKVLTTLLYRLNNLGVVCGHVPLTTTNMLIRQCSGCDHRAISEMFKLFRTIPLCALHTTPVILDMQPDSKPTRRLHGAVFIHNDRHEGLQQSPLRYSMSFTCPRTLSSPRRLLTGKHIGNSTPFVSRLYYCSDITEL